MECLYNTLDLVIIYVSQTFLRSIHSRMRLLIEKNNESRKVKVIQSVGKSRSLRRLAETTGILFVLVIEVKKICPLCSTV